MMKFAMIAVTLAACAVAPDTDTEESDATAPISWMLGTWHCSAQYHNVAPFVEHTADATYVFTADAADPFLVRAVYSEVPSHEDGIPLVTVETWHFGAQFPFGGGPVTIDIAGNDGSAIHSTGFGANTGLDANNGTYTGPDGVSRGWMFSARVQADGSWLGFYSIKPTFNRHLDLTCRRDVDTQGLQKSSDISASDSTQHAASSDPVGFMAVCNPFDTNAASFGCGEVPFSGGSYGIGGSYDLWGATLNYVAYTFGVWPFGPFNGANCTASFTNNSSCNVLVCDDDLSTFGHCVNGVFYKCSIRPYEYGNDPVLTCTVEPW